MHDTLQLAITSVNKIKASPLNDCLFRQFCHENDEDFERLFLHTATTDPVLSGNLKQRRLEIVYFTDIFEKVNKINIRLRGNKMNLIKAEGIISSLLEFYWKM